MKRVRRWLEDAERLRAFHGWCTVFWVPFTIFAHFVGLLESVVFVSVVSMVALFLGSFASWQGARTEVKEDLAAKRGIPERRKLHTTVRCSKMLKRRRKVVNASAVQLERHGGL